jgi:dTDP-4-amino-4,6-dideoxygalactose transaminase
MMHAIPRYGVRHVTGSTRAALDALGRGEGIQGSAITTFEKRFAEFHGVEHAVTASYGRMAFYYILRAFDFPRGSEIIFPALTFWVVPEIARICGLRPVFVDIDPDTFTIDPKKFEAAITPRTVAVVPTHLYGQPCDMDPVMATARSRGIKVIEDCAHSLGATYHGVKTGVFGDAALFSFQMLKGLNAYGGGMALTNDDALGKRIRALAESEPWPAPGEVKKRIQFGEFQRGMISPWGFTFGLFVAFYIGSYFGAADLSRFLWEKIRSLDPLPESYKRRFSNAQAIVGLFGLQELETLNAQSRDNAARLTQGLRDIASIVTPPNVPGTVPVFYQYCIRASNPAELSRRAIRRGIDIEIMHVDICSKLDLFKEFAADCPVAESTENTLQLPVYARLKRDEVNRILKVIRASAMTLPPLTPAPGRASGKTRSPESRESRAPTTLGFLTDVAKSDPDTSPAP